MLISCSHNFVQIWWVVFPDIHEIAIREYNTSLFLPFLQQDNTAENIADNIIQMVG